MKFVSFLLSHILCYLSLQWWSCLTMWKTKDKDTMSFETLTWQPTIATINKISVKLSLYKKNKPFNQIKTKFNDKLMLWYLFVWIINIFLQTKGIKMAILCNGWANVFEKGRHGFKSCREIFYIFSAPNRYFLEICNFVLAWSGCWMIDKIEFSIPWRICANESSRCLFIIE